MQYFRINTNTEYRKVKSKNKAGYNICQKPNKNQNFIKSSCLKVWLVFQVYLSTVS